MKRTGFVGRVGRPALATALVVLAPEAARSEEIRVLLIRPESATAVPADALRTFKEAILQAVPGVSFVPTMREATDLIELTRYKWSPNEEYGVSQSWEFYFRPLENPRPLDNPEGAPTGRVRPGSNVVIAGGKTLAESTQRATGALRDSLRRLFFPPGPVAPK